MNFFWSVVGAVALLCPVATFAATSKYDGQFLIPSNNKKEVWYVSPKEHQRVKITVADGWASASKLAISIPAKDLEQIPLALTTVKGKRLNAFEYLPDADADGLPDALEKALGTDADIADTDGDGYLDGDEVRFGYSPIQRGGRSLKINTKILTKYQRSFVRDNKGYLWYIHPETKKRYWVANAYSALEFGSLFGKTASPSVLKKIKIREMSTRSQMTAVSTPVQTPTPARTIVSATDCGELVYLGPIERYTTMAETEKTPAMKCWQTAFASCTPKTATLVETIGQDIQRTQLEIQGPVGNSCSVKRTYIHAPAVASVIGQSADGMDYVCSFDTRFPFAEAYTALLPDSACSGRFIDLLSTITTTP